MEGFRFVTEVQVIWRDMDALGHVNNAVYATYFESARIEYLRALQLENASVYDLILAEMTITFTSPALLHEHLLIGVKIATVRNSSFIVESQIVEKEAGRLIAVGRAAVVRYDYQANRSSPIPPEWRAAIDRMEGRSPVT